MREMVYYLRKKINESNLLKFLNEHFNKTKSLRF